MPQNPSLTTIFNFLAAHSENALTLLGTRPDGRAVDNICAFGGMLRSNAHPFTTIDAFAEFLRSRKPTPMPSRMEGVLLIHGSPAKINEFAWTILNAANAAGHAIETKYTYENEIRLGESRVLKLKDNALLFQ